jgi:hypothetical protein
MLRSIGVGTVSAAALVAITAGTAFAVADVTRASSCSTVAGTEICTSVDSVVNVVNTGNGKQMVKVSIKATQTVTIAGEVVFSESTRQNSQTVTTAGSTTHSVFHLRGSQSTPGGTICTTVRIIQNGGGGPDPVIEVSPC